MTKPEPFNYLRTGKLCHGINDFGLLREKSEYEEKPKPTSAYFTRIIFAIGVLAGITVIMCLVLADKYQKSTSLSHHYASFVYPHEQDVFYSINHSTGDVQTKNEVTEMVLDDAILHKLQNLSNNLSVEEINHMQPMTTVLRPLNTSRSGKQLDWKNGTEEDLASDRKPKKGFQNLADLLKRTELKPISARSTTDASIQFAQLESYKNYRNVKNLQYLMKYINCNSVNECDQKERTDAPPESTIESTKRSADEDKERIQVILFTFILFSVILVIIMCTFLSTA